MKKAFLPLFLGLITLSACTSIDGERNPMAWGCPVPPKVSGEASGENSTIDWASVHTQTIRIRHDEYSPMMLFLRQNKPAIVRFYNADDGPHDVWGPELMRALEIHEVQIGDSEPRTGCFFGLRIPPGKMLTMKVVPHRDGRYAYHDSVLPTTPIETPEGIVHIRAAPMDWVAQ